jgi:hypothetical protein
MSNLRAKIRKIITKKHAFIFFFACTLFGTNTPTFSMSIWLAIKTCFYPLQPQEEISCICHYESPEVNEKEWPKFPKTNEEELKELRLESLKKHRVTLYQACCNKNLRDVKILLESGAYLDKQTIDKARKIEKTHPKILKHLNFAYKLNFFENLKNNIGPEKRYKKFSDCRIICVK